jgi:hypothetical protein
VMGLDGMAAVLLYFSRRGRVLPWRRRDAMKRSGEVRARRAWAEREERADTGGGRTVAHKRGAG